MILDPPGISHPLMVPGGPPTGWSSSRGGDDEGPADAAISVAAIMGLEIVGRGLKMTDCRRDFNSNQWGDVMNKLLLTSAAILALAGAPASAATLVVGAGTDTTPLASTNDFASQLAGLGLTILRTNASLTLNGPANIQVDYFASESTFVDTFHLGTINFSETNKSVFAAQLIGTLTNVASGPLAAYFTSSGHANNHAPGSINFGYFLPRGTLSGAYTSNVIWIGYDDQINNADDNHDDFILRLTVTPVPEPATWAMMIGGFGMLGAALRRRRATAVLLA